jgi:hypothetical protein
MQPTMIPTPVSSSRLPRRASFSYGRHIFQLDFIGAFLQSPSIKRVTQLPEGWRELCPEFAEWFGNPTLRKSICDGRDTRIDLTHLRARCRTHLERLQSRPTIYKRTGDKFIAISPLWTISSTFQRSRNAQGHRQAVSTRFDVNYSVKLAGTCKRV